MALSPTKVSGGLALLACAVLWTYSAGQLLVLRLPVEAPDAIVSLASHEWERLPAAAAAAARFPRALVILTQPTTVSVRNCHDCEHRTTRLIRAGVSAERIHLVRLTEEGTIGEARACADFARAAELHTILVVTSPYHTRRALAVFRDAFAGTSLRLGIEPATDFSAARPTRWWMSSFDRWYVTYEWSALVYYALWHGIWPAFDVSVPRTLDP